MASPRVIVIGAGMSGLLMGIKLREAGIESFEILEQAAAVGGTWRDNTYPGLLCDVPAHTYTYSFEPNPHWRRLFAAGPEIRDYFEHVAEKYALRFYIRFNTKVDSIVREEGGWTVRTGDGSTRHADFVVTCVGGLVHPKYPEIEGLDAFSGMKFHSARWDHSVELKGKRVGVIGTGSTATQITCALAGNVQHYSLFQRSAQWVCPQFDRDRPEWMRALQRRFPWFAWFSGRLQSLIIELTFARAVVGSKLMLGFMNWLALRHLNTVKDPELRRRLTPNYAVGCKRQIFSDQFYEAIQRPNTELVTDKIARVESRGIVTQDGKLHELDVLVLATGFHALDYIRGMNIVGEDGRNLGVVWAEGAKAHRSVALPGFPNFFMIIGPHSPVGNYSLIDVSEIQIGYVMTLIRLFQQGRCASVEPRPEAMQHYNAVVRDGLKNTVWTSGCVSWYLDRSGLPNVYPFTPSRFRREMKQPRLEEFELTP